MKSETVNLQQVLDAVEALRVEVSGLSQRLAALEAAAPAAPPATQASASAEQLSEELVLTISAAIAAYLGVKPHIRQIRLLGSASWAQQGRATIQASHALAVQHG
jgi:methylmalonyl-CoA carboxyltransferase large subunit